MTDRSLVSSDASIKGKKIIIHTGNGPVISDMYESTVVADGLAQNHVALPCTANTVSIGSLNVECKVGFQWLQPLSHDTGCSFGFQALSPTDLDAHLLEQISSSSKYVSSNSLKQGTMHYDGLFKLFPCRIAARTPERLDSDPVLIVALSCCASPSAYGCGRPSVEACVQ